MSRFGFQTQQRVPSAEPEAPAASPPVEPLAPKHEPVVHSEFVERESSRVRVYTPSAILEGSHHHPPGVRLSDSLRNQVSGERYMLLTDVTVHAVDGSQSTAPLVLISSQHASVIIPLDE
jgi:hypothetical protein